MSRLSARHKSTESDLAGEARRNRKRNGTVIPFKVDDRDLRDLDRRAKELGLTRSEVFRLAIRKLIGKWLIL